MNKIKLKSGYVINEILLTPDVWEKLKKAGDKELYKKDNKYGDYEELRIYINEFSIEMEGHILIHLKKGLNGTK